MFKLLAFAATAFGAKYLSVKEPLEGSYLIVFKPDVDEALVSKHMDVLATQGMTVKHQWNIDGKFRGYNAITDKAGLETLLANDDVIDWVEEDGVVRANCDGTVQSNLPTGLWGLSRTSNPITSPPTDYSDYLYEHDGSGVNVYILDTGIQTTHADFGGRAVFGSDFTGEGEGDGNGHGTHCAGTACGTEYGIAKRCKLIAVKCLNRQGSGSFAGVISAVDWTAADRTNTGPKVGSMSLGGGFSASVNSAVDAASAAGVTMVVASGNSNANACNFSPASATSAVTVNSVERGDRRSSFSNFGTCTDIFAPGSSVLSAWIGSNTATNTISGTSMACPHVAGQAAKVLQADPSLDPAGVKRVLDTLALDSVVSNPGTGSPNKLLYGC